jgi:hypothetical protein
VSRLPDETSYILCITLPDDTEIDSLKCHIYNNKSRRNGKLLQGIILRTLSVCYTSVLQVGDWLSSVAPLTRKTMRNTVNALY